MINPESLPVFTAGTSVTSSDRFTVRGVGFDDWPEQLVLNASREYAESGAYQSFLTLHLVSKSNTELVFSPIGTHTYSVRLVFEYFSTPLQPPRQILEYGRL